MNANRIPVYSNNKRVQRKIRLVGDKRTNSTHRYSKIFQFMTQAHGTHTGLKATTGNTCLSSVSNNFSTASKPCRCSLLHSRNKPTTTIAICSHIISHTRNDWWYCMIATCIVGGIQCVYRRDSFCTGSDTNSIDYNVIVWVREETETEKWYSTVDPNSHFGTHNERRGICHRLLSTRTKRRHTLSKLGPSFRRWLLLGVCDWKSLIDHESVPNSITCCCAFCCCVFLLCLLRWSFGIQNILS